MDEFDKKENTLVGYDHNGNGDTYHLDLPKDNKRLYKKIMRVYEKSGTNMWIRVIGLGKDNQKIIDCFLGQEVCTSE